MQLSVSLLVQNILSISSFFSAFVGLAAAVVMLSVVKKFGTGIVADGFKHVTAGVVLIASAMFISALVQYYEITSEIARLLQEILMVVGTYTIVIGAKSTADKLEEIHKSSEK